MALVRNRLPIACICWGDRSLAAHTVRSEACTAAGGFEAIASARVRAAPSSSSAGTTSLTNPIRIAVAALIRSAVPVSVILMTSPNGMRASIRTGSKTAGIA